MGQTLTNGIFLPNEGERNCYTGLAGNWRAIDGYIGDYNVHVADAVIHVSQADRDKWDAVTGKADSSALTAHTGDTTIHVTAADKQTWDAVTSKANDAEVMHKSGAETIAGVKTFSAIPIFAMFDGIRFRCAHNSNAYVTFRNATQANPGSIILSANDGTTETAIHIVDKTLIPYTSGDIDLGTKTRKWKSLNGLNPGALSLPDLSAGVDISSYITLGTYHQDTYTPPSDGYISIMIYGSSANGLFVYSGSFGTGMRSIGGHPTYGQVSVIFLPVRAGTTYTIENTGATNIGWAYFYPCMGNI